MPDPRFTYDDVRRILVDYIGVDPADLSDEPTQTFEELGLDSLTNAELQVVMQENYGIEIADVDAYAVATVPELVACMNLHAETSQTGRT